MAHRVEFDKDALLATADDLMTLADEFDDLYTAHNKYGKTVEQVADEFGPLKSAVEKSAFEQASFVTEKQLGGVEQSLRIDIESSSRSLKHTLETQITELQDSLAYTAKKRIEDEVAIDSLKSAVEQLTKQLGQQWDAQQGKLDHMAEEFTAKLQLAADATEEAVAAAGRAKNKGVDASALKMPDGRTLQEALTSLEDRCHKGGMPLSDVDDRRLRDVQVMAARHQKDIDTLGMESKMARGDTSVMDEFHHDIKAVKADIHSLNEKIANSKSKSDMNVNSKVAAVQDQMMEQMNITNDAVATVSSRLDHVGGVHDEINDQQQADIEKQAAALAQLADDWGEKNKAVDREADKLSAAIVKNTADISSLESFKDASTRRLTKETERIDKAIEKVKNDLTDVDEANRDKVETEITALKLQEKTQIVKRKQVDESVKKQFLEVRCLIVAAELLGKTAVEKIEWVVARQDSSPLEQAAAVLEGMQRQIESCNAFNKGLVVDIEKNEREIVRVKDVVRTKASSSDLRNTGKHLVESCTTILEEHMEPLRREVKGKANKGDILALLDRQNIGRSANPAFSGGSHGGGGGGGGGGQGGHGGSGSSHHGGGASSQQQQQHGGFMSPANSGSQAAFMSPGRPQTVMPGAGQGGGGGSALQHHAGGQGGGVPGRSTTAGSGLAGSRSTGSLLNNKPGGGATGGGGAAGIGSGGAGGGGGGGGVHIGGGQRTINVHVPIPNTPPMGFKGGGGGGGHTGPSSPASVYSDSTGGAGQAPPSLPPSPHALAFSGAAAAAAAAGAAAGGGVGALPSVLPAYPNSRPNTVVSKRKGGGQRVLVSMVPTARDGTPVNQGPGDSPASESSATSHYQQLGADENVGSTDAAYEAARHAAVASQGGRPPTTIGRDGKVYH